MALKLFPPFIKVEPKNLISANESVSKLYTSFGFGNVRRWEQLLEKIKLSSPLSPIEKIQLALNIVSIPDDLHLNFKTLFVKDLTEEIVISVCQSVVSNISPPQTIGILTSDEVSSLANAYLSEGIKQHKTELTSLNDQEFVDLVLEEGNSIENFLKSFSVPSNKLDTFSLGQKRLSKCILSSRNLAAVLNTQFTFIFALISEAKDDGVDALGIVDDILKNYFMEDPRWTTKVLDEKFFLFSILKRLPQLSNGAIKFSSYKHIEMLRKKRDELEDILKLLNDSNENRGTFWKRYLSLCEYVESKEIGRTGVATVFAFSNFAVVEFAPMGAALLYDRSVFDQTVRRTRNWRSEDHYMPFPPYTNDGRLLHLPANNGWWSKFNEVLVLLLRNGARL